MATVCWAHDAQHARSVRLQVAALLVPAERHRDAGGRADPRAPAAPDVPALAVQGAPAPAQGAARTRPRERRGRALPARAAVRHPDRPLPARAAAPDRRHPERDAPDARERLQGHPHRRQGALPRLLPAHVPLADRRLLQRGLRREVRARRRALVPRHGGRHAPPDHPADHALHPRARREHPPARRRLRHRPHAPPDRAGAPRAAPVRRRSVAGVRAARAQAAGRRRRGVARRRERRGPAGRRRRLRHRDERLPVPRAAAQRAPQRAARAAARGQAGRPRGPRGLGPARGQRGDRGPAPRVPARVPRAVLRRLPRGRPRGGDDGGRVRRRGGRDAPGREGRRRAPARRGSMLRLAA